MSTLTTVQARAILRHLVTHETDINGIAAALQMRIEEAGAAIVELDARGFVMFIAGHGWCLTGPGYQATQEPRTH